jgi:hypothetical protein
MQRWNYAAFVKASTVEEVLMSSVKTGSPVKNSFVMAVNIINVEMIREIRGERDEKTGMFTSLKPVEGGERTYLDLQLPSGAVVRAEVSMADFDKHLSLDFERQTLAMAAAMGTKAATRPTGA